MRRGALVEFEELAAWLVPSATSGQFEEALKSLGEVLGFTTQRPDNEQNIGPDVLWLLDSTTTWTIEAKSRKKHDNSLRRAEHSQLLQALQWVQKYYPNMNHLGIVVHPNANATESVTVGQTMALTLPKLGELVGSVRTLLEELISKPVDRPTLEARCESRLRDLQLCPGQIEQRYLSPLSQHRRYRLKYRDSVLLRLTLIVIQSVRLSMNHPREMYEQAPQSDGEKVS